jgi:translation initiation factor 2 subunit 3
MSQLQTESDNSDNTITVKYSDIINKQATLNIGTIGHVSHGKTTTVGQLTGERTQKHEKEIIENKTIHIGYASSKIWKCPETGHIACTPATTTHKVSEKSGKPMELISHVSFVDCPGHADFMCTMIGGTTVMDAVFLLIAANDPVFPQEQTYEHLLAMSTTNVTNYLVLQNKLDLITKEECLDYRKNISEFLDGSPAGESPIIPVSAQLGQNMEVIGQYIANGIDDTNYDPNANFKMFIIRSFDNNRPDTSYKKLLGGSIGGSIVQGTVHKDDYIEIRPGYIYQVDGEFVCQPIISKVKTLFCGKEPLDIAFPGGLKAIGLEFDPALSKNNGLAGQIAGTPGTLPGIYNQITFEYKSLNKKAKNLKKMKTNEEIIICVNAKRIPAKVIKLEAGKVVVVKLTYPVCIDTSLNMTILRRLDTQLVIHSVARFLTGEEVSQITYPPKYQEIVKNIPKRTINIEYDVKKDSSDDTTYLDYYELLENITFKTVKSNENEKFQLVAPNVVNKNRSSIIANYGRIFDFFDVSKKVKSKDSVINNVVSTLEKMESDVVNIADFLQGFIKDELNTTGSIDEKEQLILRGFYRNKQIEGIMVKFVQKYNLCTNCNSYNTLVTKHRGGKNKHLTITCLKCSANTTIN